MKDLEKIRKNQGKRRKIALMLAILVFLPFLSSCNTEDKIIVREHQGMHTTSFFAMDTLIDITINHRGYKKSLKDAFDLIMDYAYNFAAYEKTGDLADINKRTSDCLDISGDIKNQIEIANFVSQLTKGALDITIYPLVEAWGFPSKEFKVPRDEEIQELLSLVDYSKINLKEAISPRLCMPQDMKIDLGALAKGYTGDMVESLLKSQGAKGGLISLGGNIQVFGLKADKSLWRVGLQDPQDEKELLGLFEITDRAIVTSGSYQRNFIENDLFYHHILDPRTGYPADNELLSVTIVTKSGTYADALSTGLFVLGMEESLKIWKETQDFEAIFVTKDNLVYITEGLKESFTSLSDLYEFIIIPNN